jgi:hypothetical protein
MAKIRAAYAHKNLNTLWTINAKQQGFPQNAQKDSLHQGFWHMSASGWPWLGVLRLAAFQFFLYGGPGYHQ